MAGEVFYDNDGKAISLSLSHTIVSKHLAVVSGILGIAQTAGDSGDTVALRVDDAIHQFWVPDALDPSVGDIIYVDIADITGHSVDDTAFSTTAGSGKVALCLVTQNRFGSAGDYHVKGKSFLHVQTVGA